jgi:DNA topoisomerase-2
VLRRFIELFADQDYDGGHIVGLIINWLHACWPSLLELRPDFVRRFASPVIIVRGLSLSASEPLRSFLSQVEFKAWLFAAGGADALRAHRVQYFKGLGSHTQAMGRTYFMHPEQYVLTLEYAKPRDEASLVTFFDPGHAAARKALVSGVPRADALNYGAASTSMSEFLELEVLPFFRDDVLRSLPWPDGLKRTQRKLVWAARLVAKAGVARKLTDLAMKCGEVSNYHHGEASLYATLVGMAQAHAGTNNINLFMCSSMMGSRLTKRNKYSAPRYLTTGPSSILPLLLRPEDDPILVYRVEDGDHAVEPVTFYPVVPLDVLNGTDGVGTGWKTIIPAFHLSDILAALRGRITGDATWAARADAALPWYDGLTCPVIDASPTAWHSIGVYTVAFPSDARVVVTLLDLPLNTWVGSHASKKIATHLVGQAGD